jgi:uncharacterized coiled-coil DUF342 family protein
MNNESENEQFNKLDRRILMLEEKIKNIDEKLDVLTDKIDTGFRDIGKTYVRKDNYRRDFDMLLEKSKSQDRKIKSINNLVWLIVSTVLVFLIENLLRLLMK